MKNLISMATLIFVGFVMASPLAQACDGKESCSRCTEYRKQCKDEMKSQTSDSADKKSKRQALSQCAMDKAQTAKDEMCVHHFSEAKNGHHQKHKGTEDATAAVPSSTSTN